MTIGICYDNFSGNAGDLAIGISVKKILTKLKLEFAEGFDKCKTAIIGGGLLLRKADPVYDRFKLKGAHLLNCCGIYQEPDDLDYLSEYQYVSVRSTRDRNKLSFLKEVSVVPCTTMLLEDQYKFNLEKDAIGIHLASFSLKGDIPAFIDWANSLNRNILSRSHRTKVNTSICLT